MVCALALLFLAAATLPVVAFAVEGVMGGLTRTDPQSGTAPDPGNFILSTHLLLMALTGAAVARVMLASPRRTLVGLLVGIVAAILADLGWVLLIGG